MFIGIVFITYSSDDNGNADKCEYHIADYEGDKKGTVVERYNKGTDAIQALKDDKINCVILDEQPSLAYTEKNSELKILKEEFAVEDYAICIDKSNTDLKSKINDALKKLKDDGTLANIKKNYTGKDEEKGKFPYKKKKGDGDFLNGMTRNSISILVFTSNEMGTHFCLCLERNHFKTGSFRK